MKNLQKRIRNYFTKKKAIPEEEKIASPVFTTFDQGGWCECSHCKSELRDFGDHCPYCGYKFVFSGGPIGDIGDSWGGSDF